MSLSEEVRSELAGIAPRRQCDRLSGALRALPFRGADPPARARTGFAASRPLELGRGAARVQPAPRLRRSVRDPELQAPLVRRRDPVRAPRLGRRAGYAGAARGRRRQRAADAAGASAASRRGKILLPGRVSARSAARRGERLAGASGAADGGAGRRGVPRRDRRRRGHPARDPGAGGPRRGLREGRRADRRAPRGGGGAPAPCSPSPSVLWWVRRRRGRTASRTPITRTSCGRAERRARSCGRCVGSSGEPAWRAFLKSFRSSPSCGWPTRRSHCASSG